MMKRKILIVDDNEANRYAMARFLRNDGYDVQEAASGSEALDLANESPAVIILDVKLPDILGFEVCRRLKQNSRTEKIPVLQTSASFVRSSDLVAGVESGADAYLRSPFEPGEMIAAVRSLIRLGEAEDRVARIRDEWQASLNGIGDCICLVTSSGTIRISNAAFDEQFRRGSVAGDSFPRLLGRQGIEAGAFFRSLETGLGETTRHLVGDECWVLNTHPLPGKREEQSIVCILSNQTSSWLAEKHLRESEQRFRQLADAIPQLVWVVDVERKITFANSRWKEHFQSSPESLDGWFGNIHPDDRGRSIREWEKSLGQHQPFELEHRYRDAAAKSFSWHLTRGVPEVEKGEVRQWFFTSTLIEDQKAAELSLQVAKEEAETANRTKSAFLANVSHEIRTPLTSIIGFAEVLRERAQHEDRRIIDTIWQSGQQLLETLNSVLDLARLEGRKVHLKQAEVRINDVALALEEQFRLQAREAGLELQMNLGEEAPVLVSGNGAAISRILMNLLSNAIKFTETGWVRLSTRREGDLVVIEVADTGIGIDDSMKKRLFEPFSQAVESMSGKRQGIGLGLAITKELVTLMNGAISVESTEGEGSTFRVTFPAPEFRASIEPTPKAETTAQAVGSRKRGQILLVEDNSAIIDVVKALAQRNHDIVVANTPQDALEALEKGSYSAILMDFNLSAELNGLHILNEVRSKQHLKDTPVIAFTAFALPEDRERFLSMGFSEYLSKPFTARDLDSVLSKVGLHSG